MSKSNDDVTKLGALGSKSTEYKTEGPNTEILETFPNKGTDDYLIKITHPEFTSSCPKTGQPDFAKIYVEYIPDKVCVETKSFKLYMVAFRTHQSFMETIVNKIKDDLLSVLQPKYLKVVGEFNPRGGTYLTPMAVHVGNCFKPDLEYLSSLLSILDR
jgi:7-cyano-7-deazaguanine reductase